MIVMLWLENSLYRPDSHNTMYRNQLSPPIFPAAWASEFGEDRYGLWMAFTYHGVRQVLRWIPPGTFMMGSPDSERGRWEDEVLHEVTLTKGFWLAETTVTQVLWQAVKGDNPSRFKGDNRPVEQVSWQDAQDFIQSLNTALQTLQPDYVLRLPTEAEWEYACRAGTSTPFSFDGDVSLAKVNYRGTWDDYSAWGEGALQATAEVKSYPCNACGLYEMHGNVWEWCSDWYGGYPTEAVTNPVGAPTGSERVVRGGSWRDYGRDVRSAIRIRGDADNRNLNLGFRLALGL
jgi:sulfatase modifying factor 1